MIRKVFEEKTLDYNYWKQNIKCQTGCLPDDQGFLNIISNGVPGSFMPLNNNLPAKEIDPVKEYIKTISFCFEEDPCNPIAVEKPLCIGSADSIEDDRWYHVSYTLKLMEKVK